MLPNSPKSICSSSSSTSSSSSSSHGDYDCLYPRNRVSISLCLHTTAHLLQQVHVSLAQVHKERSVAH
jgi:hypothetical protein